MYYRILDNIAIRSWKYVPRAYYVQNDPYAYGLSKEEFECLQKCDGEHDLQITPVLEQLTARGLIGPCRKGERPSEWSGLHSYDNRYFPKMNLMITGKCNYNCLHCFNCADNAPLMSEWNFEDLCHLLDEAKDCGIHAFTITGGEPMLHPHFMDICREIGERGMFVEELNTNGSLVTQQILDRMKEADCRPLIKISFDGIGTHDWMRARKGAEKRTIAAIKLCADNGFEVKVQTQVNKKTCGSLLETIAMMEEAGAEEIRLIRTTEVDRWVINAGGAELPLEEYYDKMLSLAGEFVKEERSISIDIWQFLKLYPQDQTYEIVPVMCGEGEYRGTAPVCKGNRGMVGVTSEGDIIPCLQMSGFYKEYGISLGNLHESSLKSLLIGGPYYENVCSTVEKLRRNNKKCGLCQWFQYCCGGCRALGLLHSGSRFDPLGEDPAKCLFFDNGWYQKVVEALPEYTNRSIIKCAKGE